MFAQASRIQLISTICQSEISLHFGVVPYRLDIATNSFFEWILSLKQLKMIYSITVSTFIQIKRTKKSSYFSIFIIKTHVSRFFFKFLAVLYVQIRMNSSHSMVELISLSVVAVLNVAAVVIVLVFNLLESYSRNRITNVLVGIWNVY